eukprot:77079_1
MCYHQKKREYIISEKNQEESKDEIIMSEKLTTITLNQDEKKDDIKVAEEQHEPERLFSDENHKVIIMCGKTGTGKTTLINSMMNHIYGIDHKDKSRLKLIVEKEKIGGDADSHTDHITSYTIKKPIAGNIDYDLTIIDTPGFCDNRGIIKDMQTLKEFRYVFEKILTDVDGICFVVKSSDNRLDASQIYVFNNILNLWGKDVAENIFILMTFADGGTPTCMDALDKMDVLKHCTQRLKMNNSAFTSDPSNKYYDPSDQMTKMFWTMGMKCFREFFSALENVSSKAIETSKQVLIKREVIKANVNCVSTHLDVTLKKRQQIENTKQVIRKHREAIDAGQQIKWEEEVVIFVKRPSYTKHLICTTHKQNCHSPCLLKGANREWEQMAQAHFGKDFNRDRCVMFEEVSDEQKTCVICGCDATEHERDNYKYVETTQIVSKSNMDFWDDDYKQKYNQAIEKTTETERMLQKLQTDLGNIEKDIDYKLMTIKNFRNELQRIALRPQLTTVGDYIDELIQKEMSSVTREQEKIAMLQQLKKQEQQIAKVQNDEITKKTFGF